VDVEFAGQEGCVRFAVTSTGRVERIALRIGPLDAEIHARMGLDLARLRDELGAVLTSDDLSGEARLASVENDFHPRVALRRGKGTIEGAVTEQFASDGSLSFTLTTDQSYLGATIQQPTLWSASDMPSRRE
jgi:hypothetical protein